MIRSPWTILARTALAAVLALGTATALRAETAVLRDGRSLEVTGYRMSDARIVLRLSTGGEVSMPASDVLEIRRQPREESPAPPVSPPQVPAPQSADSAPAGPASNTAAATGETLLPIGGVFDPGALHEMAGKIARRHGVDEALVHAVIQVESRYDPFAVSPRGAMGLMQLMPRTAERFEVTNAFDPVQNVDGGVRYLKELLARYSGQVRLALAAYNAGEEAVERHGGIPPYRETIDYVKRVLSARR
ncbi:MAG TPA: lytic transglycosylase domain-containing protein [Patescibacteria group bacterium]|nr:lytic transglycosylase domain-containing protein [Patescibacteria group bacterium]